MWKTIGQPEVITSLQKAIQQGNLAHAYILIGPEHVGKTTLAIDIARALNCDNCDPPCDKCESCRRVSGGNHTDITIVDLNYNTNSTESRSRTKIGIDDVKDIERQANLSPYEGKCKVFIIDGAENLSTEAANSFLKTLEEPPDNVFFVLLSSDEKQLLPTLISRCQRIELKRMGKIEIKKILINNYGFDENKADLLARLSEGCLGWALTVSLDEGYLKDRIDKLSELESLLQAGLDERFAYVAQLGNDRKAIGQVIRIWITWWRDLLLMKNGCGELAVNYDLLSKLGEYAQEFDIVDIIRFIDCLYKSLDQISQNANLRLVLEVLILDMPRKEDKAVRGLPALHSKL
jgi:DNA polymerase-3 subunit delta'